MNGGKRHRFCSQHGKSHSRSKETYVGNLGEPSNDVEHGAKRTNVPIPGWLKV
jgi:hypothetical protein